MRLFIAVPVPEELKGNITRIQEKLKEADSDIKLVKPENLHFTIKFLGETPEEKTAEIKNSIEKACANFSPFDIGIAGIAAFPSRNYARVIWLYIKNGIEQMETLMKNIDGELSLLGFVKEKDYVPHLTLARVRSGRNKAELLRLLEQLEKTEIGKMKVKEVKVMKSTLSRKGPVYGEVFSLKLK